MICAKPDDTNLRPCRWPACRRPGCYIAKIVAPKVAGTAAQEKDISSTGPMVAGRIPIARLVTACAHEWQRHSQDGFAIANPCKQKHVRQCPGRGGVVAPGLMRRVYVSSLYR